MADSCSRKLSMLRLVPRYPSKTSTRDLLLKLSNEGFKTTQRTIQRDLNELATTFPDLQSDGNKDMAGWFWSKNTELLSIPAIDPPVAFTLKLADTFLSRLMPPAVTALLDPFKKAANIILKGTGHSNLSKWQEKVQILPRTQQLIPAKIKPDVIRIIYTSLLEGKQFSARYQRRDNDIAKYEFNPLGIVYRESVIYLVATVFEYEDPRHYALHRFEKVKELDSDAQSLKGFKLTEYIKSGAFDYGKTLDKTFRLKALFKATGKHLLETPLSDDQKIKIMPDGRYQVSATVMDSLQIRWWLLGFGDQIEVLQPKSLRNEFAKISQNMCHLYIEK